MDKRLSTPLILGLLLIPYGILFGFHSFNDANMSRFDFFTEVFRRLFLVASLLLFLGIIWRASSRPRQGKTPPARLVRTWLGSFMLSILFASGSAIYINPHARFAGMRFRPVALGARSIKTEFYGKMEMVPDIVILGSSRAFTLSPKYIESKTAYTAFNMSVDGGRAGDFTVELNYVLKSDMPPRLLVIEVSQESFAAKYFPADLQPLALIPYMPIGMAAPAADGTLRDILGLQSLSDSVYVLLRPSQAQDTSGTWTFERDGLGIYGAITHEQYVQQLGLTIDQHLRSMQCRRLNPEAKQKFEALIALAQKNDVGIVLYISPMHAALYNAAYENDLLKFDLCRRMLQTYLRSLTKSNPNLFFRDLSDYEIVNHLEEDGFYDAVHLNPKAAGMTIDALLPEIKSAMAWSFRTP